MARVVPRCRHCDKRLVVGRNIVRPVTKTQGYICRHCWNLYQRLRRLGRLDELPEAPKRCRECDVILTPDNRPKPRNICRDCSNDYQRYLMRRRMDIVPWDYRRKDDLLK